MRSDMLQILDLSDNKIKDISSLAAQLLHCPVLTELCLSNNNIQDIQTSLTSSQTVRPCRSSG